MSDNGKRGKVLVIGGGISGISAAIEASEAGCEVVLVEKEAYMGGRVARSCALRTAVSKSTSARSKPALRSRS